MRIWERRFVSNTKDTSNEFIRVTLRKIAEHEPLRDVVLVLDNAPSHGMSSA